MIQIKPLAEAAATLIWPCNVYTFILMLVNLGSKMGPSRLFKSHPPPFPPIANYIHFISLWKYEKLLASFFLWCIMSPQWWGVFALTSSVTFQMKCIPQDPPSILYRMFLICWTYCIVFIFHMNIDNLMIFLYTQARYFLRWSVKEVVCLTWVRGQRIRACHWMKWLCQDYWMRMRPLIMCSESSIHSDQRILVCLSMPQYLTLSYSECLSEIWSFNYYDFWQG